MNRIPENFRTLATAVSAVMLLAPLAVADDPTTPGGGQDPPGGGPDTLAIVPSVLADAITRLAPALPTLFVL